MSPVKHSLKIADEVWLATAQLHRAHPNATDFSVEEIVAAAHKLEDSDHARPGVYVHVIQHCVANRPPNPGRYRILYEPRTVAADSIENLILFILRGRERK